MDASRSEFHHEGRGYIYEINDKGEVDKPPLEVLFVLRHLKYGATNFATEIRPVDRDMNGALRLVDHLRRVTQHVTIESIEPNDYPFRIDHINGISETMNTVTIKHGRYDLGITNNYEIRDNKLIAIIGLSRCQALRPLSSFEVFHYQGHIEPDTHGDDAPREVTNDLGVFSLALDYSWEQNQVIGSNKGVMRIESPRITVDLFDKEINPRDFFDAAEQKLDSLLTLLSFFSREHVAITSIELKATISRGYVYPCPRRLIRERKPGTPPTTMFNSDAFPGRDLSQLLQHFDNSDAHDVLVRTMRFIVSSYEVENLESAYFLAHAAIEAICKELTKDLHLKKIENLPPEDYDRVTAIFSKMQENLDAKTKKRSVMDYLRVIILLERLDIDLDSLGGWRRDGWDEGFEKGIKQAFTNRNDLFHEGLVQNPRLLIDDLQRLQFIFELITLKKLGISLQGSGYWPINGW